VEATDANSTILLFTNKSQSINEIIHKGVAPVPSKSVRPSEINEAKKFKNSHFKKFKTKRKNKSSMIENCSGPKIDSMGDYKNMMNSNRIIEPFSPTFQLPEDVQPSNQTSFRPLAMSKYNKNLEKHYNGNDSTLAPSVVFNETRRIENQDSRCTKANHNCTQSSNADTIDFDKLKHLKENDGFKETGKFVNPLSETSEARSKSKSATRRHTDSKESTLKTKRRPKTGNGRYSRSTKAKNKSEERTDTKRIFSKSVEQSYNGENSAIYKHDGSIMNKLSKIHEESLFHGSDGRQLVSPHNKINKLIKESIKKK